MIRTTLRVAGASLALFHVWLFAGQAWDGALADPTVAASWLAAGGLIWALDTLRRAGTPMFHGRKAVAVWLLAALLHGPAIAQRLEDAVPAPPEVVAALAQVSVGFTALTGMLLLAALLAAATRQRALGRSSGIVSTASFGAVSSCFDWRYSARPPPAA